jgi:hypothetical protein
MSFGRGGMPFAGAFLISRLGGSRRRFGRTIASWGFNRFLLFAAPSVLVPSDQSTHLPCIVLPRHRRCNRPDKPKTCATPLPQSGFVQVALWETWRRSPIDRASARWRHRIHPELLLPLYGQNSSLRPLLRPPPPPQAARRSARGRRRHSGSSGRALAWPPCFQAPHTAWQVL